MQENIKNKNEEFNKLFEDTLMLIRLFLYTYRPDEKFEKDRKANITDKVKELKEGLEDLCNKNVLMRVQVDELLIDMLSKISDSLVNSIGEAKNEMVLNKLNTKILKNIVAMLHSLREKNKEEMKTEINIGFFETGSNVKEKTCYGIIKDIDEGIQDLEKLLIKAYQLDIIDEDCLNRVLIDTQELNRIRKNIVATIENE